MTATDIANVTTTIGITVAAQVDIESHRDADLKNAETKGNLRSVVRSTGLNFIKNDQNNAVVVEVGVKNVNSLLSDQK